MLKRFFTYIFLGILVVSCYTLNKPEKPKHLISKKEMISIIIDLKLISSSNGANKKILEKKDIYSDDYVYKKYNIDSATFASNNNYYAFYVKDYEEIYKKVQDSLEELSQFYTKLEDTERKEKRKQDSINSIRKKDSINSLLKPKASLKEKPEKDSIVNLNLKHKTKPKKLIQPVSDKASQSQ